MTTSKKLSTSGRSSEIWSIMSTDMDSDSDDSDRYPVIKIIILFFYLLLL